MTSSKNMSGFELISLSRSLRFFLDHVSSLRKSAWPGWLEMYSHFCVAHMQHIVCSVHDTARWYRMHHSSLSFAETLENTRRYHPKGQCRPSIHPYRSRWVMVWPPQMVDLSDWHDQIKTGKIHREATKEPLFLPPVAWLMPNQTGTYIFFLEFPHWVGWEVRDL